MSLREHILPDLLEACIRKARDLGDWVAVLQGADRWLEPPDELVARSGRQDLRQALVAADWIFSTFQRRYHAQLFDAWADDLAHEPDLPEIVSVAVACERWEFMFNEAYLAFMEVVRKELQRWRAGEPVPHELNDAVVVGRQMVQAGALCAASAGLLITDILCEAPNAELFMSFLEQALERRLQPADHDRLVAAGAALGIDPDDIYRLLGNALEQLRKMIEANSRDAKRIGSLVLIAKHMPDSMAEELAKIAAGFANLEALAALMALNMQATCGAVENDELLLDAIGIKGIGGGANLLVQWHEAKPFLRGGLRERIKAQIKNELLQLAVAAAAKGGGSLESGLVPRNDLRRFHASDDLDLLNIEETVDALISSGKQLCEMQEDDLFVHDTARGQAAFGVLLDISGSMSGEDLANCSIAVLVLVLRVRSEEVAIALFESNTHVMKTFEDPQSLDHVADQVLELQAQGGTCVDAALIWAADQFDSAAAPLSVLFLLSDFCFFERNEELDPHLERLAALKVQWLAASVR
ncbi:MAG: VWA domain-containing protein [Planctomycetales bacterium]|nr:VWA domain-containing protein [Planctomycetales bacterium]